MGAYTVGTEGSGSFSDRGTTVEVADPDRPGLIVRVPAVLDRSTGDLVAANPRYRQPPPKSANSSGVLLIGLALFVIILARG